MKKTLFAASLFLSFSCLASFDDQNKNLLRELVEINSGTANVEGQEAMRKRLIPEFTALGYEVDLIDAGENRKVVSFRFKNAQPKILLVGHVDTVFDKTSTFQHFSEQGNKFMGPGVNDMKGGIVLMLSVLKSLKDSDLLKNIAVVLNDDEEIGSPRSAPILKRLAAGIPYGLIYEPIIGSNDSVVTTQAGVKWLEITVKGQASHAGAEHQKGINACLELSHKIEAISALTNYSKKLTVNAGVIKGGTKANVVCEEASVIFDVRYVEETDLNQVMKQIQKIADKSFIYNKLLKKGTKTSIKELVSIPSLSSKSTNEVFEIAKLVAQAQHFILKKEHMGGASDGNQLAPIGIQLLGGLGPWGDGAHSTNEVMDGESFDKRKDLSVGLIKALMTKIGER